MSGLPDVWGEYGVVAPPEVKFSNDRPWVKIRGVAKDRYQKDGAWVDGDPLFIDILVGGKPAENLAESVTTGDLILVKGTLRFREYEVDGEKRKEYNIRATDVGVSLRFEPAVTRRMQATGANPTVEPVQPKADDDAPPF